MYCKLFLLLIGLTSIYSKPADEDTKRPRHPPFHTLISTLTPDMMHTCLTENGIAFDQVKKGERNALPEVRAKMFCVEKCGFTAAGLLNEEGEINTEVIKNSKNNKFYTDDQKEEIIQCLDAIEEKITTCDDIKKVIDCDPMKPSRKPE